MPGHRRISDRVDEDVDDVVELLGFDDVGRAIASKSLIGWKITPASSAAARTRPAADLTGRVELDRGEEADRRISATAGWSTSGRSRSASRAPSR